MLMMEKHYSNFQFIIAGAPSHTIEFYQPFISNTEVQIVFNQTYQLLKIAKAALVTSGTATLETALLGVPEVVCYKGGAISFGIAKQLIKVKYISLVNLIMDEEIVKELIQSDFNEFNLKAELNNLLNHETRNKILSNYSLLTAKLGGPGASKKTADLMINYLK